VLASVFWLVECTPPYSTQKRMAGPAGLVRNLPEPNTVKAGKSQREDVLGEFREVDTGVSSPWFFWARWKQSSAAFSAVTDSGLEKIPFWSATNLLVDFDDAGTVKTSVILSDGRIIPELQRIVAAHPETLAQRTDKAAMPVDFYTAAGRRCLGKLALSSGNFEFVASSESSCPSGFDVPAREVTVSSFAALRRESDPGPIGSISVKLSFSNPTNFGNEIVAKLTVRDLVSVLGFIEVSRPGRR
jgi:hypothetical protein